MENTNDRTLQANSPQRENEQPETQDFGLIDNPNEIRLDGSDTTQQSQYASARDEDDEDDDRDDDDRDDDDDDRNMDDDDDDFDNDEAPAQSDWGVVDPLEHPGPPSDMHPTAPGSAV